jgi:hypothetical protein
LPLVRTPSVEFVGFTPIKSTLDVERRPIPPPLMPSLTFAGATQPPTAARLAEVA